MTFHKYFYLINLFVTVVYYTQIISFLYQKKVAVPLKLKKSTSCVPLPPNTTSILQSLNLGIMQNFKLHYHQLFLQYVLAKIEEYNTASELANSVNVLKAIQLVSNAWGKVKQLYGLSMNCVHLKF